MSDGGKGGGGEITETKYDQTIAEIAGRELQLSEEILHPVEDYIVGEVQDVDGRRGDALDIANVEGQAQFGRAKEQMSDVTGQRRSGLGSGADIWTQGGYSLDRGQSIGLGQADATQAVEDAYAQNLDALGAYGQGAQADGLQGLGEAARLAENQTRFDVQQSIRDKHIVAGALGTAGGIGLGIYKGAGEQAPTGNIVDDGDAQAEQAWQTQFDLARSRGAGIYGGP